MPLCKFFNRKLLLTTGIFILLQLVLPFHGDAQRKGKAKTDSATVKPKDTTKPADNPVAPPATEVDIALVWSNPTVVLPKSVYNKESIFVSLDAKDSGSRRQFIEKTTIGIFRDGKMGNKALLKKLINDSTVITSLITKGIVKFDLAKYLGLKEGDKVYFYFYLGEKDGKEIVDDSNIQPIPVGAIEENENIHMAGDITVQKPEECCATPVQTHRRDMKKMKGAIEPQEYFFDCPTCTDEDGDLVYDYLENRLMKVSFEKNGDEKFSIVQNFSEINVKEGELLRIKVVGFNRYLGDIKFRIEDSIYNSETPAIFGQFFSGSSDFISSLTGKNNTANGTAVQALTENVDNNDLQKLTDKVQTFYGEFLSLLNRQVEAYLICAKRYCCQAPTEEYSFEHYVKELSEIQFLLVQVRTQYLAGISSGTSISQQIDDLQSKIATCQKTLDAAKAAKSKSTTQKTTTSKITTAKSANTKAKDKGTKATSTATTTKKTTPKSTATNKDSTAAKTLTATAAKSDSAGKSSTNGQTVATAKTATDNTTSSDCTDASLADMKQQLADLQAKVPGAVLLDEIKKNLPSIDSLRKLYIFDRNAIQQNFVYHLPPIYPKGDVLHVGLKFKAYDSVIGVTMGALPMNKGGVEWDFPVRHRWSFSFSTGPYFAFSNDLLVSQYGWQELPSSGNVVGATPNSRLVKTGNAPLPFGVASFANLGYKFTGGFGLAASVGAGLTLSPDVYPGFMVGLSPTFGDKQRLNLTLGVGGFQVKELQSSLYMGNVYSTQPTLEYDKRLKFGFFASVSYSIFTSTSRLSVFSGSGKQKAATNTNN